MTAIPEDLIERVALAIREADVLELAKRYPDLGVPLISELAEECWGDHLSMARAAIEAMRHPDTNPQFAVPSQAQTAKPHDELPSPSCGPHSSQIAPVNGGHASTVSGGNTGDIIPPTHFPTDGGIS